MSNDKAKQLLDKYFSGNCSPEEILIIKKAYNIEIPNHDLDISEEKYEEMKNKMWDKINANNPKRLPSKQIWIKISIAASLLIIATAGWMFYSAKSINPIQHTVSRKAHDIAPGGNKAVLTLGDGSKINLTDIGQGEITDQKGYSVSKTKEGILVYKIKNSTSKEEPISFNTIETPIGGQYHINLPDGTSVLLNASSSLKFPTRFSPQSRTVELLGEGYFEVSKDKTRPFIVTSNKQRVEVLGTHFNISSYANEKHVKTTLLEGSVKIISANHSSVFLTPGQQSILGGKELQVKNVDVENVIAWKNGYFLFNEDNIEEIMRQITRWYGVDVRYNGNVPDVNFTGAISRKKNLSAILKSLEETGNVEFKLKGEILYVKEIN